MFMGQNLSLAGTKVPSSITNKSCMSFIKQSKRLTRCTTSHRFVFAHFGISTSLRTYSKSISVVYNGYFYSVVIAI